MGNKIIIEDFNNFCIVQNPTTEIDTILFNTLTIKSEKPWFSKAYKKGLWDGYYRYYSKKNHAFPAGLRVFIEKRFNNVLYVENNLPETLPDLDSIRTLSTITPHEHQISSVTAALKKRRGILQAPTGSGKSICITMLCKAIRGNCLIMVHTKNLLHQMATTLEKELKEPIGRIGDGVFEEQRVTVGIVASLRRAEFGYLNNHELLIADEIQHISADTFYKTALKCTAPYRIGLSADALDKYKLRQDHKAKNFRIIGCFGPIIHDISNEEMKEKDILAVPSIKFIKVETPSMADSETDSYDKAYCNFYCKNEDLQNKVEAICSAHKNKSILILVKHIAHGNTIVERLKESNIKSEFVYGETESVNIDKAVNKFKNKKLPVLVASNIFNEGTDIPEIEVLINAAGDIAATKQRLGRALRKGKNKDTVTIYDFYMDGNIYMKRHARKRIQIYLNEGHKVV